MSDKKYLLLDYRFYFNNELYENDPDLNLNKKDKVLFKNEWLYLQEKKLKIIDIMVDFGWVIIEDTKDLKDIPYKKIKPDLIACSKSGYPCDVCGINCLDYDSCIHKKEY